MASPIRSTYYSSNPYQERLSAQVRNRRANDRAIIENPLAHFTDKELQDDVQAFVYKHLPSVRYDDMLRAARVAKDIRLYDEAARRPGYGPGVNLPVHLTKEEKVAIRRERDVPFSERGMRIVIATVSLAAFLQGFVQSSFNGAAVYKEQWGLHADTNNGTTHDPSPDDWRLGAANASPWFAAALIGCPLALPINYWFGRRGGMCIAAFLIFSSSVGAIFATKWYHLVGIRVVNGLGMGIKAVSTPILASETAVGFWRGSAILAWQLWVAFGIMMGFAFNLIFTKAKTKSLTLRLIQGAPLVPSLALLVMTALLCPESPRYHLMKGPNYSVEKAYTIMRKLRNTELQALRDLYVVYKSLEQEYLGLSNLDPQAMRSPGFRWAIRDFFRQFVQLFQQKRLYNAVISTATVSLVQQLCGINVLAFYSGTFFGRAGAIPKVAAMGYSLGFGAINFLFALPAIRSIDTLGRRKWLLITLPFMSLFMLAAALSFKISHHDTRIGVAAFFLLLFAAVYSPGVGPIPFTLASESFPLSHREAGAALAISINLGFAGLLSISFPSIISKLKEAGTLGVFSGLNVVALVLVFLLVEETKRRSLEDLDHIFAVSKREFMRFQTFTYLPWLFRSYLFGSLKPRPELYEDTVWGPAEGEDLPYWPTGLEGLNRVSTGATDVAVELGQNEPAQHGYYVSNKAQDSEDFTMRATNIQGPVSDDY
ncbi:Putative polyol transporter 2-like protein [Cladobotryum mycophilum]|uniref:Polyol transporter 2-like protein n=1 Tax=Cladobotryum mycophilum TaxID=491253 RepID=A0ABR0SVC5_9HYPO